MPDIGQDSTKLTYKETSVRRCQLLVLTHHYSQRMPASIRLCYAAIQGVHVVACCLFSTPASRWPEEVLELSRLVRTPDYDVPLSGLIAKAVGYLRSRKLADLLVSLADAEEDHHGGIYQSCSWLYDGLRGERLDGFNVEGEFLPARTANSVYGTSSVVGLASKLADKEVTPHVDLGKHCYWKPLSKSGMQKAIRLGLRSRAYPKPMLDSLDESLNTPSAPGHIGKGVVKLEGCKSVSVAEKEMAAKSSSDLFNKKPPAS